MCSYSRDFVWTMEKNFGVAQYEGGLNSPSEPGALYVSGYSYLQLLASQDCIIQRYHYINSHSIKLSTPRWAVQILTIFRPQEFSRACQWCSVRSDEPTLIMIKSKLVVSQYAPVSGMTFSLINNLLYPRRIAGVRFARIFRQTSSGQSWRTECM